METTFSLSRIAPTQETLQAVVLVVKAAKIISFMRGNILKLCRAIGKQIIIVSLRA